MIKARAKLSYVFGTYRVDAVERVLFNEKGPVSLTPKAFDTLLALVENSGRILTTDDLMAQVWPAARGIRCALAISEYASRLGIQMRVGLHTGECEMIGAPGDIRVCGIAPHIGAQVANAAAAGEILVSGTVKDLVAGSGIRFEEKAHTLAEVPGEWRLFAVERGIKS